MKRISSNEALPSMDRIRALLNIDAECDLEIEDLSHGFCNTVHLARALTPTATEAPVVVKLYSAFAKVRHLTSAFVKVRYPTSKIGGFARGLWAWCSAARTG